MYATEFALTSFCGEPKDSRVNWFTDNRRATKIVEVGNMRYDSQCFALRIFQICLAYKISLDIQWVPRNEVAKADFISRFIDVDVWQISRSMFLQLERLWGPHTVDFFANHYNFKISRFFSRFWNPGCARIVFSFNPWVTRIVWLSRQFDSFRIRSITCLNKKRLVL